ncbi:caax prenyl protease 2 [Phtheirospermum japonicum]|uniref:intramembrane prenyl-peptidase Rce1 n=1 Tax=Phtheirospermum japonicum TaxID=374723 RepID=A0A830DB07_9LAMI|nr:caax prenyl protease 2 [Phtheirospermum japonicum]
MEQEGGGGDLSKSAAVAACTAMAVFYVAILYSPTLILRLPPPDSFKSFMIRRFVCAGISSIVSLFVCFLILPIKMWNASILLGVYGIRLDHIWQALALPFLLTSLMYSGSFILKLLSMLNGGQDLSVAPVTEELVFRACMIPLLLCGGFSTYTVIFLSPIFFSLAHLNHLMELCLQKKCSLLKACQVVGFQLGYTVIFGAYASFLLVRTGHLAAPLVAHIFCNFMGLPVIFSRRDSKCGVCNWDVEFFVDAFPIVEPAFVQR